MPARRPFADVLGTTDGPHADAAVLEIDRPTAGALGCAALTAACLVALTTGASTLAFSAPATVHRVLAGAAAVCFLVLLGLLLAAGRTIRRSTALAFDRTGLWWTDSTEVRCLPWNGFRSAQVLAGVGSRRSRSGQPQLELLPDDPAAIAEHPALREKLTGTNAPGTAKTSLRLTFALPGEPGRIMVQQALEKFAPSLLA